MKSLSALCKVIGSVIVVSAASLAPANANVLQPATNLTGNIGITLVAPGGNVSDSTPISTTPYSVPAANGTLVSYNDGTEIGGLMLGGDYVDPATAESISLSGDTFLFRIDAGSQLGTGNSTTQSITGYLGAGGKPAEYQFTGLTIPGQAITGLLVTSSYSDLVGTIDINSLVNLSSPSGFTVNLDRLIFNDQALGSSYDHLDLSVELVTSPVPEPMMSALLVGGLLLLLATRRGIRATVRLESRHV